MLELSFSKTVKRSFMIRVIIPPIMFFCISADHSIHASNRTSQLGTIEFLTSGSEKAQQHFLTGVAALHSFWYTEALEAFQQATKEDSNFAMGYWGEAMAHNYPLWEQQDFRSAKAALSKISDVSKLTRREQDYVNAVQLLYPNAAMKHEMKVLQPKSPPG